MPDTSRRVAEDTLPDGKWISTVRLPSSKFRSNYETMVFPARDNLDPIDGDRYSTETEAKLGHDKMVGKWSAALQVTKG